MHRIRTHSMKSRTKVAGALFFMIMLSAAVALAGHLKYSATHITSKSPEAVWKVITAYKDICDKGCKYGRPDLVVVKRLSYKSTPTSWYTWSQIDSTLKDVRYFTHVTIERTNDGHIIGNNRQLDKSNAALIEKLEKSTGLKHRPAFDSGNTRTSTSTAANGKTKISVLVTLQASGILAMWEGRIRKKMAENVNRTFSNIDK